MGRSFTRASHHRIEIAAFPDIASQFTLSAWVRYSAVVNFLTIFGKGKALDGNDRNFCVDFRGGGIPGTMEASWTSPASTFVEYRTDSPALDVWSHICWTIDWTTNPDTVLAYRNGVAASVTHAAGSNNSTPTFGGTQITRIGDLQDTPTTAFNGDIAEVAAWMVFLSDKEVAELGKGYPPHVVRPADLLFYAPMIRDLYDYSHNQHALTNQGTVASDHHPPMLYPGGL